MRGVSKSRGSNPYLPIANEALSQLELRPRQNATAWAVRARSLALTAGTAVQNTILVSLLTGQASPPARRPQAAASHELRVQRWAPL